MSNKLYSETAIQNIASSIRNKNGTQNTYTVSQMPQAILDIPTGGGQSYNNGKNNFWVYINEANTSVMVTIETSGDTIDWGDGTVDTNTSHIYVDTGIYIISADSLTGIDTSSVHNNIIYIELNNAVTLSSMHDIPSLMQAKLNNSSFTFLPSNGFSNCGKLQIVDAPYLTSISNGAFSNCTSLTNITIPTSVTSIGQNAFQHCVSLTTLTIPVNVVSIDSGAFGNCTSMQEYHFLPIEPPELSATRNVFENIPNDCVIYVPASSVTAYQTADYWSTYASYIQAEPND